MKLAIDTLAEMLQRSGSRITKNDRSDKTMEMFKDNNNPLSEYLEYRDLDYFLNTPDTYTYTDYKAWCSSNYVRNPIDKSDFRTLIENYFGVVWKKSVRYIISGKKVVRAGFKKK